MYAKYVMLFLGRLINKYMIFSKGVVVLHSTPLVITPVLHIHLTVKKNKTLTNVSMTPAMISISVYSYAGNDGKYQTLTWEECPSSGIFHWKTC